MQDFGKKRGYILYREFFLKGEIEAENNCQQMLIKNQYV